MTRTAQRLGRATALYCVISWRLVVLTLLGDGPPGHQILWKGLERLTTATFVMDMLEHEDD